MSQATIDKVANQIQIETERLCLRKFEPHDLEPLHRLWNDAEVMQFIRPGWTPSREDVAAYFEEIEKRWAEHGFSHFAVTLENDNELIGYCGFQHMKELPEIELLYGLAKPYWSRGYTTEAAGACLRFVFENTSVERIIALANPLNKGSWRVMEKIGMKFESMVTLNELELVCYAITPEEFRKGMNRDALLTS